MQTKAIARKWLPPVLLERLRLWLRQGIYFTGRYDDWGSASAHATGYDSQQILERVKEATLKVKRGEAVYERDSVLFDEVQHSFPVLAGLLCAALEGGNRLAVLDFGGSLGSSYRQCRDFLSAVPLLKWGVVEQDRFVRCGQELFTDEQLRFFYTIAECAREIEPNLALLSSVLQYLPEPYAVLDELVDYGIPYLLIDRTPFSDNESDCITVQHVPPSIYPASYPCWIFARKPFLKRILSNYELLAEFDSSDAAARANRMNFKFCGMILRKK